MLIVVVAAAIVGVTVMVMVSVAVNVEVAAGAVWRLTVPAGVEVLVAVNTMVVVFLAVGRDSIILVTRKGVAAWVVWVSVAVAWHWTMRPMARWCWPVAGSMARPPRGPALAANCARMRSPSPSRFKMRGLGVGESAASM